MARRVALLYWGTKGSGSGVTLLLASHLMARDPDLGVLVSVRRDNPDLPGFRASGAEVIAVNLGRIRSVALAPVRSLRAYLTHFGDFRRLRPDPVVVTMNSPLCVPFVLALRAIGTHVVFMANDAEPHPGDYHRTVQRLANWLLMRCAGTVVALSSGVEKRLRDERRCPGRRLLTIPLETVYPARTSPHPAMPAEPPVALLFLGRLLAYKGLPLLRDALAPLRNRTDWRLTVAGEGPLSGWVSDAFGDWPQVTLELGWLSDERVDALIDSHHLMVCPYQEASQSGVVALSLARGLPVAVTPEGALPEQVEPLDPRLVASASTPEAFRAVVEDLLDEPMRLDRLSKGARDLVARRNQERGWLDLLAEADGAEPDGPAD